MSTLRHLKPWRRRIAAVLAITTVGSFAEAFGLVAVAPLAQTVASGEGEFSGSLGPVTLEVAVTSLGFIALTAVVVSICINIVGEVLRANTAAAWGKATRLRLLTTYLDASWPMQVHDRAGRLQEIAGADVVRAASGPLSLIQGSRAAISLIVLMVGALVIDPRAAGTIALSATVLFALLRPMVRVARGHAKVSAGAHLGVGLDIAEAVSATRDVRLFGTAPHFLRRMAGQLEVHRGAEARAIAYAGALRPLYQGSGLLIIVAILLLSSTVSDVNVASLGAVALLLLRSFNFGQQLLSSYQRVNEAGVYLDRIAATIAEYVRSAEREGSRTLESLEEIRLEQVSYSYDGEQPAVENVDLVLHRGEIVGIAGPSGSGKSTMAQLLLRLRRPDSGRVLADGAPLDEFDHQSWSRAVALVPQDVYLIHGTVRENISFFRDHVSEADVLRAARAAGIHETVVSLPDGYDTLLGRSERALSGGQVQRIGVARALAANPQLLVLDEPTSALDRVAEEIVHDAIAHARSSAIVVVIAHRQSTLEVCDTVVSISEGRIVSTRPGVSGTRAADVRSA